PVTGQAAVNLAVQCGDDPSPFRPFLGYGDITHLQYAASSIYHAAQFSVRRTMGSLNLSVAYTYSHSIDDSSDRFDGSFVDSANPSANRASSNFDQRHILNISYVWDLPGFKSGLTNAILGGWQFSGVTSYSTGTPYSVVVSNDNAGVSNGVGSGARPDLVGDPRSGIPSGTVTDFGPAFGNAAAFAQPRGLTLGDAGRNILNNPNRLNFDWALFKHIKIREQMGFEFRAEAFNVFNHTEWGNIAGDSGSAGGDGNNTLGSDSFLRASSAHNARIMQLGLKFNF
ncbi:MAG: carboxypeptidase regulatory-like domain-containing protein, partial [Terriglobales bacterium]